MLTVKSWKQFWFTHLFGILIFLIPILIFVFICSSSLEYLGQNISYLFAVIIKSYPLLVFYAFIKILTLILVVCCALHFFSMSLKFKSKFLFGILFFNSVIIREMSLYPALTEKWWVTKNIIFLRHFIQHISMLSQDSHLRFFLNWQPFLLCAFLFALNFFLFMKNLIQQGRIVQNARNSIYIDELDVASKIFSIQGLSFLIFILFSPIFLISLNSSLNIDIPKNKTQQTRPHVFIFAADSLRYDRLANKKYAHVMPYLTSQLKNASLFKPMLIGVPRTFPSWVEIALGAYSLKTGVRTMFPSKSSRQGNKNTIFEMARQADYSTLFVSDFAGDVFSRYPFGGEIVDTPSSDLMTVIENGMINFFTPIQAILVLPYLQRIFPALLESPEIADARLVAHAFAQDLRKIASLSKPVFVTTFFSSAHFPYASPGPWYGKFQKSKSKVFEKIPDQVLDQKESYKLNHPSDAKKEQTIALYDGGLNSIDFVIEKLMNELKKKGWLENSIVLIFGDHGENLYDGNMGMGHGDGVEGEFSNITPLVIFTEGTAKPNILEVNTNEFVKSVDIAPTIAKRLNLNFNFDQSDGMPLLDKVNYKPNFPVKSAYMETGIWFTSGKFTPENQPRIIYPGVVPLLDIDPSRNFEFYLRPSYCQAIPGVKERAWINEKYRLVVRSTKTGNQLSLYSRKDLNALDNLIQNPKYKLIADNMLKELNDYLILNGIEIIPTQNGSFFYAENIAQ